VRFEDVCGVEVEVGEARGARAQPALDERKLHDVAESLVTLRDEIDLAARLGGPRGVDVARARALQGLRDAELERVEMQGGDRFGERVVDDEVLRVREDVEPLSREVGRGAGALALGGGMRAAREARDGVARGRGRRARLWRDRPGMRVEARA